MNKLVGETLWVGILSLADLGKYHRESMAITTFLVAKNCILSAKQSCVFAQGFPPELWNRVTHCLQLKLPDHFPDDPYTLEEIHDAMCFVLHGTVSYAKAYDNQQQSAQTAVTVVNFVEEVILKIAATFLRSISTTVSVYFATMDASPFQADDSFQEQSLAKHSRITSTNGFNKILAPHLHLQPTHFCWMCPLTTSLPHSSLHLMSTFTPSKRSSSLCALDKRKVFALKHRKHVNQNQ